MSNSLHILDSLGISAGVQPNQNQFTCPTFESDYPTGLVYVMASTTLLFGATLGFLSYRFRRLMIPLFRDTIELMMTDRTDWFMRLTYEYGYRNSTVTRVSFPTEPDSQDQIESQPAPLIDLMEDESESVALEEVVVI